MLQAVLHDGHRDSDNVLDRVVGRRHRLESRAQVAEPVSEQRVEQRQLAGEVVRERLLPHPDQACHLTHVERRGAVTRHQRPRRVEDLPLDRRTPYQRPRNRACFAH